MTNLESAEQKIVKAAEDVVNAVALSSATNTAEGKLYIEIGGLLVELTLRAKRSNRRSLNGPVTTRIDPSIIRAPKGRCPPARKEAGGNRGLT